MELFDIFPSAVYREMYEDHMSLKKIVIPMIDDKPLETNGMSEKLFHLDNQSGKSFLHRDGLEPFREWLEEQCSEFVRSLGYVLQEKMVVTDSWLNICNEGGNQYPHFHTNSYISGTYYLNFKNGHAPLMFRHSDNSTHSPCPAITLEQDTSNPGKYNSDVMVYPNEGELLLWQSNLSHGYQRNELDYRISISMNFMPSLVGNDKYSYRVISSHKAE